MKLRSYAILSLAFTVLAGVAAFIASPGTVDFDNYAGYAANLELSADRFGREYIFFLILLGARWIVHDPNVATQLAYGFATALLAGGTAYLFLVHGRLTKRSQFWSVAIGIAISLPVLALASIYLRQAAALGFCLFAVASHLRSRLPNRRHDIATAHTVAWCFWALAILTHNFSGLAALVSFLVIARPIGLVAASLLPLAGACFVLAAVSIDFREIDVINRVITYLSDEGRLTGRWRVAYGVGVATVALIVISYWRNPAIRRAEVFRAAALMYLITLGYFFVTTEFVRMTTFLTLAMLPLATLILPRQNGRPEFSHV